MSIAPEPVHLIADLEQWSFPGTALAVVGRPIAHSVSPAMHNAALAELARLQPGFGDWHYFKFDIAPHELARALRLFHQHKFHGLNLTVPHKSLALEQLVSREVFVRDAGAANTLIHTEAGWHGANTDGTGLSAALRLDFGLEMAGSRIVLLGAGGAARAAALECLREHCASLWIGNRTQDTLTALLTSLRAFATGTDLHGFDLRRPPTELPAGSTVINATSLGLGVGDPAPIDLTAIARPARVYDMIYRPGQTNLLRQAAELHIANSNGLSMLVHQGARSLELWTKMSVSTQIMHEAACAALRDH
jgi:shikimate dehydrogenase